MKYLLLIYQNEKEWAAHTEAEVQKMYAEYGQRLLNALDAGSSLLRIGPGNLHILMILSMVLGTIVAFIAYGRLC